MYDNLSASIDSDGRMQTNEQFIYCMQQTAVTPTDEYNQITIKLKKSGSPNVDLKGVVMSGSVVTPGSSASMTIVECSNNIINSGDVTTSYTDYTFTFDSNHSLASGVQFGLGWFWTYICYQTFSYKSNYTRWSIWCRLYWWCIRWLWFI